MIRLIKNYIEYAYAVSNKDHDTVKKVLKEVNTSIQVRNNNDQQSLFNSPFEEEDYNYLVQRGYNIQTQVGCSGYRIIWL
ncbi:hypothetical protein [Desulfolucanica intricata]|uniref:hypothetical protein n=1 Tax=Desulfolucanica intricata TaxID=1285191 RepID=UPI000833D9C1|nr:hypothetical protein [Desulfolucanica intricata]